MTRIRSKTGGIRMMTQAMVWLPVVITCLVPGEVIAQPVTLTLARTVEPAEYTPGQEVLVTLTITASGTGTVNALGGVEILPGGWQFKSTAPGESAVPPIIPGKTPGRIEWAYISVPAFPIRFSYRVTVAQNSKDPQQITGYLLYRLTGEEIKGPDVVTAIPQKQEATMTAQQLRAMLSASLNGVDTNRDGFISFEEATAAVSGLSRDLFNQLDLDGDGQLSYAELGVAIRQGCGCLARFAGKQPGLTPFPWSDLLVMLTGLLGLAMVAARH